MLWGCLWETLGVPLGSLGVPSGAKVGLVGQHQRSRKLLGFPLECLWGIIGVLWGCLEVPLGPSGISCECLLALSDSDLQVWYIILFYTISYFTMLYGIPQYSIILYYTILYYTIHHTILDYTILYYNML